MSDKNQVAVRVNNVTKDFILNHEKVSSIKSSVVNIFKKSGNITERHQVLKGVTFDIRQGEFFGIVGRNGSGKSTLLKIIAEIYQPTSGGVEVFGKLVPFIELGVGFNPELTGRENVYLNGALLGFNKTEIDDMYDEIVEFAELEKFMDQKLKNYSSGMQVRLAFSVAIKAKGDILVLDEVLAVGDEAFQRKCEKFFDQIKKDKTKTIILVTHTMENVRKYCDKAILLRDGKVAKFGDPEVIANEYSIENLEHINNTKSILDNNEENVKKNQPWIKAKLSSKPVLKDTDTLSVEVEYQNIDPRPVYTKVIIQYMDVNIMIANAKIHHKIITSDTSVHKITFSLNLEHYNWGDCRIIALLVDGKDNVNLAQFGFNDELIFSMPRTTDVAGIMKSTASMELLR